MVVTTAEAVASPTLAASKVTKFIPYSVIMHIRPG